MTTIIGKLELYSEGGIQAGEPEHNVDLYGALRGPLSVVDNWVPEVADEDGGVVTESILVIAARTSPAVYNLELWKLEDMFRQARLYKGDITRAHRVWLAWRREGGVLQRALVFGGKYEIVAIPGSTAFDQDDSVMVLITVYRHPMWEYDVVQTVSNVTNLAQAFGTTPGKQAFTGIQGVETARLHKMEVKLNNTSTPFVNKLWMGFKDKRAGYADWEPTYEAESGTNLDTDTTSAGSISGARNSSVLRTTFSTDATFIRRWTIDVGNNYVPISDDPTHWVGRYKCLLRARLTASSTRVYAGMRNGYAGTDPDDFIPNNVVSITDTAWRVYDLGAVKVPLFPNTAFFTNWWIQGQIMSFYAERITGSGSLEWDCITLLPVDTFLFGKGLNFDESVDLYIVTRPNDLVLVQTWVVSAFDLAHSLSTHQWGLPAGDSVMTYVVEKSDGHDLADSVDLSNMRYYPRSRSFLLA